MTTRHEKYVARKLRSKERKEAIARSLQSRPLRLINTRDLQTLQKALRLPLIPYPLLKKQSQKGNLKPERLDNKVEYRETLSNFVNIPFIDSIIVILFELTIYILANLITRNLIFLILFL